MNIRCNSNKRNKSFTPRLILQPWWLYPFAENKISQGLQLQTIVNLVSN